MHMSNKIDRPTGKPPAPDPRFPDPTPESRAFVIDLCSRLDRDGPAQRLADATRLSPEAFSAKIHKDYAAREAEIARMNALPACIIYPDVPPLDVLSGNPRPRRRNWFGLFR